MKGEVSSLTGGCPALDFDVNGTHVTTDASTAFEHGTCGDVQDGVPVEVEGFQVDGDINATKVELDLKVELAGPVSGLSGSCPVLTFTVDGRTVTTDSSTEFKDGACGDVQNGTEVKVEGLRQPDGSVLASEVELDD